MTAVLDPFVLEHAPGPLAVLDPGLLRARAEAEALVNAMARLDDPSLVVQWFWDGNDVDIRYAFYRAYETLESAEGAARLALGAADSTEAREGAAAATVARWDLHGLLAGLSDDVLDADPDGGEWTVRQTLAHITGGQRGYAWGTAHWLSVRDEVNTDDVWYAPEHIFADMPAEETEATGDLSNVRRQLDAVVDSTISRYATLNDEDLAVKAGWSGFRVTVGFRQWRWSSHIAEHTVQIEKTLDMLGRRQSEVQRLARLVARAYGRLESVVYYRPGADRATAILDEVASSLRSIRESAALALAAGVPARKDW